MLPRLDKPHRVTNPNRNRTPILVRPRSSSVRPKALSPVLKPNLFRNKFSPANKDRQSQQLQNIFQKVNEDEENQFLKLMEELIKG